MMYARVTAPGSTSLFFRSDKTARTEPGSAGWKLPEENKKSCSCRDKQCRREGVRGEGWCARAASTPPRRLTEEFRKRRTIFPDQPPGNSINTNRAHPCRMQPRVILNEAVPKSKDPYSRTQWRTHQG